jgi:hypothetical protein
MSPLVALRRLTPFGVFGNLVWLVSLSRAGDQRVRGDRHFYCYGDDRSCRRHGGQLPGERSKR